MVRFPTRSDLQATFDHVAGESYDGIAGVCRLKVGTPTKKVVLAAMTHGDEPSGLGAFRFLLDNVAILRDVDVVMAIHNIEGGARWFQAKTRLEKHKCRAYGWNFNRLPLDFPEGTGGPTTLSRLRQLWQNVYPDTTHALDMHSADQPLSPDGLTLDIAGDKTELERLSDVVPASARFRGITALQMREGSRTKPVGTLFGGPGREAVALEIESDSHDSPNGIRIAVRTVIAFLTELGCIVADELVERLANQDVYDVLAATMVPGPGYRFVSDELLASFAPITQGQTLLTGPQGDVFAKHSGCLIFAPAQSVLDAGDESEEVCFELSNCHRRPRMIRLPKWWMDVEAASRDSEQ